METWGRLDPYALENDESWPKSRRLRVSFVVMFLGKVGEGREGEKKKSVEGPSSTCIFFPPAHTQRQPISEAGVRGGPHA